MARQFLAFGLLLFVLDAVSFQSYQLTVRRQLFIVQSCYRGVAPQSFKALVDDDAAASFPQKAAEKPLPPQAAVDELKSLLEQVRLLWVEGSTWSAEERAVRRRTLVESYVRVFAPALAFSFAQVGISTFAFLSVLFSLNVSGRGFKDITGERNERVYACRCFLLAPLNGSLRVPQPLPMGCPFFLI